MHEPNVVKLLERLKPSDVVLDVWGWACPFNRAQWVIDAGPFETRGYYRTFGGAESQGGDRERFSAETWVRQDICGADGWPWIGGTAKPGTSWRGPGSAGSLLV